MAFEKMTAEDLFRKYTKLFPDSSQINGEPVPTNYTKIGARMIRIEFSEGPVLYFLWYDENNWNLGTKPYRNQPKKQLYKKMNQKLKTEDTFNDLKKDVETLPPETNFTMEEAILQMKIAEAKGIHEGFSELITACNQDHPDPVGEPGERGLSEKEENELLGKSFSRGFLEGVNDAITGYNQWENIERESEAMANQPLEPIDWVKEDPEVVMASYPPSAE